MATRRAEPRSPRGPRLFLICSSLTGSTSEGQELDFIPIATERRYAECARDFLHQASFFESDSPALVAEEQVSIMDSVLKTPGQEIYSELSHHAISQELLQPIAYDPQDSEQMKTPYHKPDSFEVSAQNSIVRASNTEFNFDHIAPQKLSRIISRASDSDKILLPLMYKPDESFEGILQPLAYDPNEHTDLSTAKLDGSKIMDFLPSTVLHPVADISPERTRYMDFIGFEGVVPNDDYNIAKIANENGFCIGETAKSKINTGMVNLRRITYNQARPEVHSVYADVYASNPFRADDTARSDDDLSMRATLFPFKASEAQDPSSSERSTSPETPCSSISGSSSDQYSEDDTSFTTQDFHHALSSIAKGKAQPFSPAFGVSAKAMSLLGQSVPLKGSKDSIHVQRRTKKIPSPISTIFNVSKGPHTTSQGVKDDRGRPQTQFMKIIPSVSASMDNRSSAANARDPFESSTKLQSILGSPAPATRLPSPAVGSSNNGPRTNSTLYEELYTQVSGAFKLVDADRCAFNSGKDGSDFRRQSFRNQFNGEPIKKSTLSPSSAIATCRMPFSSEGDNKTARSRPVGNIYLPSVELTKNHAKDFQNHRDSAAHRVSFQEPADLPDTILQGLRPKRGSSTNTNPPLSAHRISHDESLHSYKGHSHGSCQNVSTEYRASSNVKQAIFETSQSYSPTSSYRQFQRLASVSESRSFTTDIDHGVPYKRPQSPVKRMFSNTFEKLGRMIPASNNTNLSHSFQEPTVNSASSLKISVHSADQNRLFGDLEYIIQDTANRFLLYQHSKRCLSAHSIEKIARLWRQKNRPPVAEFLYSISVQRQLVEQNLDTITFHGPLAGNSTAINAIMYTWKYVAQELGIRCFCLPDAGLQHFLREATRLLELLGVTAGHMLHFQAWSNIVAKTIHANYQTPYTPREHNGR